MCRHSELQRFLPTEFSPDRISAGCVIDPVEDDP
jgi:hypothetical protein